MDLIDRQFLVVGDLSLLNVFCLFVGEEKSTSLCRSCVHSAAEGSVPSDMQE